MFVQTRSSLLKNENGESCETVIFNSKRNKEQSFKKNVVTTERKETNKKEDTKLEMKKLRYEVIKFGSSGFDRSKKEDSRIALAVALGAKPPRRKYKNYAELLAVKKAEKEKRGDHNKQNNPLPHLGKGTSKWKRKPEKGKVGLLSSYGKIRPDKKSK